MSKKTSKNANQSPKNRSAKALPTYLVNTAWVLTVIAVSTVGIIAISPQSSNADITVYKDHNCGCRGKWIDHLRAAGFSVDVENTRDLSSIKSEYGVPSSMRSCHTAVSQGYFIEGHIPAVDITRLLAEKPNIKGLAVPGMPIGSPGMEVPGRRAENYAVRAIGRDGIITTYALR